MPFKNTKPSPLKRRTSKTREQRFWEKVDRRGTNECWPWTGSLAKSGYGAFTWETGLVVTAPRAVWTLIYGDIPDGMLMLHSCDNRPCVNPSHLRPGTQAENLQDRQDRKRHWRKIPPEAIPWIIALKGKATLKELAAPFGVAIQTIHKIQCSIRRIGDKSTLTC